MTDIVKWLRSPDCIGRVGIREAKAADIIDEQRRLLKEARRIVVMYRGITNAERVIAHANSLVKRIDAVLKEDGE